MPDRPDAATVSSDPSAPENNPLGLGPRDHESSNTGSTADTSYDARGSDPYTTGEPAGGGTSTPADPDVPGSDEP